MFKNLLICHVIFLFPLTLIASIASQKITHGNLNVKKGGTLTYEYYEPNHINPITFRQVGSREVLIKWVFETLLDIDVVTGRDVPRIASKWAISKSGRQFTFWIDKKAKWFDGKKITAEDVKFSFEVYGMKGAKSVFRKAQASAFSKIEIISPSVVKFTAKEKLFSNFEFLVSTLILPKHLYYHLDPKKLAKNKYTKLPRGSGPYIVESWKKGVRCTMVRNKKYWGWHLEQNKGAYNFDKIVIRYIRDAQMAFETLKKGDIDYMPVRIGNSELWRQTETDKSFTSGKIKAFAVSSRLQQGYGFIGFNSRNKLFADKGVRKALTRAVNRMEMIKKSLGGFACIPKGPLYSVDNFAGKFKPVTFDPAASLKELAALGWKDTDGDYILDKNGKKFSFTVLVPNSRIEKEMLYVQNYWRNIGVDAAIKIVEYSTWRQLQGERKFAAVSNGKSRSYRPRLVDPYREWHSDNMANGLSNHYGYSNSKVDKLIVQARQELDQIKRKKILDQVNDIIAEEYLMLQYSESKYSFHGVNSRIVMPTYNKKKWFPYALGMKYWSRL